MQYFVLQAKRKRSCVFVTTRRQWRLLELDIRKQRTQLSKSIYEILTWLVVNAILWCVFDGKLEIYLYQQLQMSSVEERLLPIVICQLLSAAYLPYLQVTCYLCLGRRKSAEEKGTSTYKTFVNAWRRHVGNAILPSTRRAIDRDWYRWHNWCDFALNAGVIVNPYRPCVESYCAFLDFYLTLFKPDTVRKYIKNINTAAVERSGYHINTHIPKLIVQRTFRSAAKRLGHAVPGTRLPLTLDILIQIKPFFNFQLHDDRMLWAILCVGIFTLARIGELVPGHDSKLKVDLNGLSMGGDKGPFG